MYIERRQYKMKTDHSLVPSLSLPDDNNPSFRLRCRLKIETYPAGNDIGIPTDVLNAELAALDDQEKNLLNTIRSHANHNDGNNNNTTTATTTTTAASDVKEIQNTLMLEKEAILMPKDPMDRLTVAIARFEHYSLYYVYILNSTDHITNTGLRSRMMPPLQGCADKLQRVHSSLWVAIFCILKMTFLRMGYFMWIGPLSLFQTRLRSRQKGC